MESVRSEMKIAAEEVEVILLAMRNSIKEKDIALQAVSHSLQVCI